MTSDIDLCMRDGWGEEVPVRLSPSDRRHHLYVLGKSGTGKTTLLRNLILQDIEAGRGVAVLDPHGDLALDLIDHLPRHRTEDLIYLDPADEEFAVGFNPFANVPPARRHLVASGIVHAFKGIYPDFFGPRMEYIFFAAAAALLDCENVTLLGLQRMLTEEQYRTWVVKQVKDPAVRAFWEREFESYDKRTKAEMVSPILNKIGPILMTPQLRNVLGQVRSRVDARRIMDEGRVFIANLSIGRLGPDKANLLGSFLVSQFQLAAMSRADLPQDERRDFMLTVDEFHSFVSDSFASILSEARKYGLCLTLAHQYLAQLKPGIIDAIVGNVGSIVTFRVGHADAEVLEKAFGGAYVASQFSGLNNREVLVKMLSEGKDVEPFVGRTLPPLGKSRSPEAVLRRRERIIRRSRERNATPREVVERRLRAWFGTRP